MNIYHSSDFCLHRLSMVVESWIAFKTNTKFMLLINVSGLLFNCPLLGNSYHESNNHQTLWMIISAGSWEWPGTWHHYQRHMKPEQTELITTPPFQAFCRMSDVYWTGTWNMDIPTRWLPLQIEPATSSKVWTCAGSWAGALLAAFWQAS
jgi:hypothetical protein